MAKKVLTDNLKKSKTEERFVFTCATVNWSIQRVKYTTKYLEKLVYEKYLDKLDTWGKNRTEYKRRCSILKEAADDLNKSVEVLYSYLDEKRIG